MINTPGLMMAMLGALLSAATALEPGHVQQTLTVPHHIKEHHGGHMESKHKGGHGVPHPDVHHIKEHHDGHIHPKHKGGRDVPHVSHPQQLAAASVPQQDLNVPLRPGGDLEKDSPHGGVTPFSGSVVHMAAEANATESDSRPKIGRASCRERV